MNQMEWSVAGKLRVRLSVISRSLLLEYARVLRYGQPVPVSVISRKKKRSGIKELTLDNLMDL